MVIYPDKEIFLAIERNEALTHVPTWINLENISQNERCQSQNILYDFLHMKSQNKEIHRNRK